MNRLRYFFVLLMLFFAQMILTGCQNKSNLSYEYQEKEEENSETEAVVERAVLYLEDGAVLADHMGNFLSDIHEDIEEEDIKEHLSYIRFMDHGKTGYLSAVTGEVYLAAEYDSASAFAPVMVVGNGTKKWFISQTGETISGMFDDAFPFESQDCYARVKIGEKWGIADRDAEYIVPCKYDYINELPYIYTLATGVRDGAAAIISLSPGTEGEVLRLEQYCDIEKIWDDSWCFVKEANGKMGLISTDGTEIVKPAYKSMSVNMVDEDIFILTVEDFQQHFGTLYFKMKDKSVTEIIEPVYDNALHFSSGNVAAAVWKGRVGVVDMISRQWKELDGIDEIHSFGHDMTLVSADGLYGFLDKHGEIAVPIEYSRAESYDLPYTVVEKDGLQGVIDGDGRFLLEREYDDIVGMSDSGYVVTKRNGRYQIYYVGEAGYSWYEAHLLMDGILEIAGEGVNENACSYKDEKGWHIIVFDDYEVLRVLDMDEKMVCSGFFKIGERWWEN